MTWTPKIMPDDAPELAGSLVGSILGVKPVNSRPSGTVEPSDTAWLYPFHSSAKEGQPRITDVPLCEQMARAYPALDIDRRERMANVLDVVADWLVPQTMPSSGIDDGNDVCGTGSIKQHERRRLRDLLIEQTRIAREWKP